MIRFTEIPSTWQWRCEKAGLTVTELAKIAGTSQGHLSELIRGKRTAGLLIVQKVEDVLAQHGEPFKLEYIQDER